MKTLRKILSFFFIVYFALFPFVAHAANTNSIDLEATSSQYINRALAGSTNLDNITSSFTLEFWVKPEALTTDMTMGGVTNRSGADGGYFCRFLQPTTLDCKYVSSGSDIATQASSQLTAGVWTHVAFVHNNTTDEDILYVDGTAVTTNTGRTGNPTAAVHAFRVGARSDVASDYWDGLVDEVRFWNVARTATEITNNKSVELVGNETGLQLYYKLVSDASDETANNNDGTLVNAPSFSTDVPFGGAAANNNGAAFTMGMSF